jgi:response regulator RpfG family c-di-GMP phosphodiesterase
MARENLPKILCVDDESHIVESLALHLRRDYEVHTAVSGEQALLKLKDLGPFAVIVSDMRMPAMDGATLLNRVMKNHPDTSRILLTGEPGRDVAVSAVNEGQIFRFLTKPCPPDRLKVAVQAGVVQYRLATAERVLLQETLIGCIQTLVDVLAITNPVAFGRASRIKRLAMDFAEELGCKGFWQLEAAAMLSQLGYLSLPVELVEKLYYGEKLTEEEKVLASGVPQVAQKLLGHIPRLEPVLQILHATNAARDQIAKLQDGTVGLGAQILSLVLDYDSLIAQGNDTNIAVETLRARGGLYDTKLFERFATRLGAKAGANVVREMPLRVVQPGMTLMHDLRTSMGTLLVPRGFEITETFLQRIANFGPGILAEKVQVLVPAAKAASLQ